MIMDLIILLILFTLIQIQLCHIIAHVVHHSLEFFKILNLHKPTWWSQETYDIGICIHNLRDWVQEWWPEISFTGLCIY